MPPAPHIAGVSGPSFRAARGRRTHFVVGPPCSTVPGVFDAFVAGFPAARVVLRAVAPGTTVPQPGETWSTSAKLTGLVELEQGTLTREAVPAVRRLVDLNASHRHQRVGLPRLVVLHVDASVVTVLAPCACAEALACACAPVEATVGPSVRIDTLQPWSVLTNVSVTVTVAVGARVGLILHAFEVDVSRTEATLCGWREGVLMVGSGISTLTRATKGWRCRPVSGSGLMWRCPEHHFNRALPPDQTGCVRCHHPTLHAEYDVSVLVSLGSMRFGYRLRVAPALVATLLGVAAADWPADASAAEATSDRLGAAATLVLRCEATQPVCCNRHRMFARTIVAAQAPAPPKS
jgi:hypothetical protein